MVGQVGEPCKAGREEKEVQFVSGGGGRDDSRILPMKMKQSLEEFLNQGVEDAILRGWRKR